MADKEIKIKFTVDTADSAKSLKDIKQAIKDLKDEALNAKFGSKEFKDASAKAAELQDNLEDLTDAMKSLKGTGVEKLNSSMKLLKDGLSNFDGTKVSTAFKGIGSAMKSIPIFAIISAFQFLSDIFVKVAEKLGLVDWIAKKVEKTFYAVTDALGITNKAAENESNNFVKNQQNKKDALIAFYDSEIKAASAAGKNTVDLEKKKQEAIRDTTIAQLNQLRAQGYNNLTDEQKKTFKELKIIVDTANTELKVIDEKDKKDKADKQAKSNAESIKKQEDHNKKVAALQTEFSLNDRQKLAKTFDDKAKELNKNNANELKIFNEIQEAKNKALKKFDDDKELQERTAAKTLADNIANIKEKYNITQEQLDEKLKITQLQNTKYTQAEIYQIVVEGLDKQLKAKQSADEKKNTDDAKQLKIDEANKKAEIDLNKLANDAIQKNDKISADDKLEEQLKYLEKERLLKISDKKLTNSEIAVINAEYKQKELDAEKKAAEEKKKINQEIFNSVADSAVKGIEAFGNLSDTIFSIRQSKMKKDSAEYLESQKKQFEIGKKVQIAAATIQGIQGVINALTAVTTIPEPFGSIAKGINAALVATSTAANIAKIKATKFEGGGSTPDAGSTGGQAPSQQSIQAASPSQDLNLFGTAGKKNNKGNEQTIVKAYVVESEISAAQARVKKIQDNSSL